MAAPRSTVKAYVPPGDGKPILCIHTKPTYMRRLAEFLAQLDRPPHMVQLEFTMVEVAEDDLAQLRHRLNHPVLNRLAGEASSTDDLLLRRSYSPFDANPDVRSVGQRL